MRHDRWCIVLAAGTGRRLAGVTAGIPKQFWRPAGGPSLLEMTLERVAPLAPQGRTIVIVDATHRGHVEREPARSDVGLVYQPMDRGTATGVLLALTPVFSADPEGMVVITPSDHAVADQSLFESGVARAAQAALTGGVVLLGVQPTQARDDYGWIVPLGGRGDVRPVVSFVEKPQGDAAAQLLARGGVWNTMVVVARASALRALYQAQVPWLLAVFDVAATLDGPERLRYLEQVYPGLPAVDFSRDVLEQARSLMVYTWPRGLGWSDLGTPDRMERWRAAGAA